MNIQIDKYGWADPDSIVFKDIKLNYKSFNAIPFIYVDDALYVGEEGDIHSNVEYKFFEKYDPNAPQIRGRFWTSEKIICFWDNDEYGNFIFPSSKIMSKILKKLKEYGFFNIYSYSFMFSIKGGACRMSVCDYANCNFNSRPTREDLNTLIKKQNNSQQKYKWSNFQGNSDYEKHQNWLFYNGRMVDENKKHMKKIYLTESQFKQICKHILKEEEYTIVKPVGKFTSPIEAQQCADFLKKNGIESEVNGTIVNVYAEIDKIDQWMAKDIINNAIQLVQQFRERYKQVSESIEEINSDFLNNAYNKLKQANLANTNDAFKKQYDWGYNTAASAIFTLRDTLENLEKSYHAKGWESNSTANKCLTYLDFIEKYLKRKFEQQQNLEDGYNNYYDREKSAFYSELLGREISYANRDVEREGSEKYNSMSDEEKAELENRLSPEAKFYYENNF